MRWWLHFRKPPLARCLELAPRAGGCQCSFSLCQKFSACGVAATMDCWQPTINQMAVSASVSFGLVWRVPNVTHLNAIGPPEPAVVLRNVGADNSAERQNVRSFFGFLAMLATGLFAAVVVAISLQTTLHGAGAVGDTSEAQVRAFQLDYISLLLGLFLGLLLATIARISWSDLPRRFAAWLIRNEANFLRLGLAFCFLAIIVLY